MRALVGEEAAAAPPAEVSRRVDSGASGGCGPFTCKIELSNSVQQANRVFLLGRILCIIVPVKYPHESTTASQHFKPRKILNDAAN
jgi:hypothetical protein